MWRSSEHNWAPDMLNKVTTPTTHESLWQYEVNWLIRSCKYISTEKLNVNLRCLLRMNNFDLILLLSILTRKHSGHFVKTFVKENYQKQIIVNSAGEITDNVKWCMTMSSSDIQPATKVMPVFSYANFIDLCGQQKSIFAVMHIVMC